MAAGFRSASRSLVSRSGSRHTTVGAVGGQPGAQSLVGDEDRRPRVLEHEGKALRRILRIERDAGAARLQHAEQRDQHVRGTREADADQRLACPTPELPQAMRQLVGAPVQLAIGERARRRTATATASGVRATWASNSSMETATDRRRAMPVSVPRREQLPPLGVAQRAAVARGADRGVPRCRRAASGSGRPCARSSPRSKRSVLYCHAACQPPCGRRDKYSVRSNFAVPLSSGTAHAVSPGASSPRRRRGSSGTRTSPGRAACGSGCRAGLQLVHELLERQVLVRVRAERPSLARVRAARGTTDRPTGRSAAPAC